MNEAAFLVYIDESVKYPVPIPVNKLLINFFIYIRVAFE